MVANSLQSCWFQTWCISVRWHLERFLTIFWICACGSRQSLEDRPVSSTCRALAGGTGPQPQHLAIRHNQAIEVKNILVLDLVKDIQLMDMLWEDQRKSSWPISNTIDITQWGSFIILLWLQAPNRLVSCSRECEEEKGTKFTYTDGTTQHESNWQTWNVHGRHSLDFALGN